jgi:hypothetical protein
MESDHMGVKTSEECFWLALMLRWENVGVSDGGSCTLDGKPAINSQIRRMAYILRKLGAGAEGRFRTLSVHNRRQDGGSYISKDSSWMEEPVDIGDGWFFEGCTSLRQKRDILGALSKLGYSTPFVECCEEFVAGNNVRRFLPRKEEAERMLAEPEPPCMEGFEVPPEIQQILAAAVLGEKTSD